LAERGLQLKASLGLRHPVHVVCVKESIDVHHVNEYEYSVEVWVCVDVRVCVFTFEQMCVCSKFCVHVQIGECGWVGVGPQGREDPWDAFSCSSFFEKDPLVIVLFCRQQVTGIGILCVFTTLCN